MVILQPDSIPRNGRFIGYVSQVYEKPNSKKCDAFFNATYEYYAKGKKFCSDFIYIGIKAVSNLEASFKFKYITKRELQARESINKLDNGPKTVRESVERNITLLKVSKNFRETFSNMVNKIKMKRAIKALEKKKTGCDYLEKNIIEAPIYKEMKNKVIIKSSLKNLESIQKAQSKRNKEGTLIRACKLIKYDKIEIISERVSN